MKKILFGVLIAFASMLIFRTCSNGGQERAILEKNSMLIQKQIDNVSKVIVTEGHFAEVYTYKDSQKLFRNLITVDKKALVVVNAEVVVAYDLSKIDYKLDVASKKLYVTNILEPEIKIYPDFEYYDVTTNYLNQFDASDYNKIKNNVHASLLKKVEASTIKSNAKNRLASELSKFFILTNSMGWTLIYEGKKIENIKDFDLDQKTIID